MRKKVEVTHSQPQDAWVIYINNLVFIIQQMALVGRQTLSPREHLFRRRCFLTKYKYIFLFLFYLHCKLHVYF